MISESKISRCLHVKNLFDFPFNYSKLLKAVKPLMLNNSLADFYFLEKCISPQFDLRGQIKEKITEVDFDWLSQHEKDRWRKFVFFGGGGVGSLFG